jgi:hypothetical protein
MMLATPLQSSSCVMRLVSVQFSKKAPAARS